MYLDTYKVADACVAAFTVPDFMYFLLVSALECIVILRLISVWRAAIVIKELEPVESLCGIDVLITSVDYHLC